MGGGAKFLSAMLRERAGAAAVELALVFPLLATLILGTWFLGWAIYSGGEARHAVELGSRIYISNPNATAGDLQTAVASHLTDVPIDSISLSAESEAVGSAMTEHITWSYQTTASIPFAPALPLSFSGTVDVPMPTQ